MSLNSILTTQQMYQADALTIARGMAGIDLMENAGRSVVDEIKKRWEPRETIVLCGPGNNGGDGFVIARLLMEANWPVQLILLDDKNLLSGDCAKAAAKWSGSCNKPSIKLLADHPLVIDALFGAGLTRALTGDALELVQYINLHNLDCVGVDIPSGVHGNSGQVLGDAPKCCLTVTFFMPKPAHVLMPARTILGDLVVTDIGIKEDVLDQIPPNLFVNSPSLWANKFPTPKIDAHKFSRGHVLIAGGEIMTGAALLAARAARRIGAGLVTIAAPPSTWPVYASDQPGNLIKKTANLAEFEQQLSDPRITSIIIGPGLGLGDKTKEFVLSALKTKKPLILDADGISVFEDNPEQLMDHLHESCVLTPHEGEFTRLFHQQGDKVTKSIEAAKAANTCVLLKGPDTVIATPSGNATINTVGNAYLATAGSGDVLAGLIGGLMAQGMAPFNAACCAVWMHGKAAEDFGPGLIAEDIPPLIPKIMRTIIKMS